MKILFTKISEGRKKDFETITTIVEVNGKKYVNKKGVYSNKHILEMNKSIKLLGEYLKDEIDQSFVKDDVLVIPYAEGKSLSEMFLNEKADLAISLFKKIIDKIPTKKFSEFSNQGEKFYDIEFSGDEESFVLTNYDLVFSNIIHDEKGNLKVIDNEWIFDYPIPKKAIIYRAFKSLKEECPYLDIDLAKYFKEFGITDFDKYDLLEKEFQKYVLSDFNYRDKYKKEERFYDANIDYSKMYSDFESMKKENESLKNIDEGKDQTILGLNKELIEKEQKIQNLSSDLDARKQEIEKKDDSITNAENEVASKNKEIEKLEHTLKDKDQTIMSLNRELVSKEQKNRVLGQEINAKNQEIAEKKTYIKDREYEAGLLKNQIKQNEEEIGKLRNDIDETSKRNKELEEKSHNLKNKNRDLENSNRGLEERNRNLDAEKEMYKSKSENYENSTTFKLMKPYWKVRDWLIPAGSKRRLFFKLAKNSIRHPIWTLKHLNGHNVRKFKMYLKSEGADRCLERIETYKTNNPVFENFDIEVFNMKPRDEYPELIFPYSKKPLVSIIIPVYNQFPYTYGCLESILKNTQGIHYQIIIADDCSTDETSHLEDYAKNIIVVHNENNLRFLLNCNNAAKYATGKYIFFLNNDTNVQPNWLSSLLETIESDKRIGMVGSKLVYPDGRLQEAGGILWKDGSAWNFGSKGDPTASEYNYRKPVDYISGAAILIKKTLWDEIGGFDTRFAPAYCEDSDLAFEVRRHGYELIYDPFSVVIHYEGVSNGTDVSTGLKKYQVENSNKLFEKWKEVLSTHPDNAVDVFKARERCYNKKMILVIDHYVPEFDKDAGSRTVFDYLNIFADLGYSVKFIGENFYRSEPYTSVLQRKGIEVLYGPYYYNNWKLWLQNNGKYFDYVFMNRPHITSKFIDTVIETCTNAKLIYYGHDLHFLRLLREYNISKDKNALIESNKWKESELAIYDKVDLIYYPSKVEQDEVKKMNEKYDVRVLQPYVYKDISTNYNPNNRKNLLFVGGFRHGANFDGVNWFIKEVFPSILEKNKDIVLTIAGSFPPQELVDMANANIKVLGYVTDEQLEELYNQAKLVVVPLRFGAGIKGKVVEAMKHGVPVITTEVGAEGLDNNSLAVDNNFEQLLDLYNNNQRLSQLSKAEIEYIKKHYSYESACNNIINDFAQLDRK